MISGRAGAPRSSLGGASAPDEVRRNFTEIFACIESGDLDGLDGLVAFDVVDHKVIAGQGDGLPGVKYWARTLRTVIPDLTASVAGTVVEGTKVAGRVKFAGTIDTAALGPAPTDSWIEFEFFAIIQFHEGLAVHWWDASDTAAVLRDLGVGFLAPGPQQPARLRVRASSGGEALPCNRDTPS